MESKKFFFPGSFQDSAVWVSIGLRSKNLFTPISAINPFWDNVPNVLSPLPKSHTAGTVDGRYLAPVDR